MSLVEQFKAADYMRFECKDCSVNGALPVLLLLHQIRRMVVPEVLPVMEQVEK